MTGGSRPVRSSLHFGATAGESAELNTLRRRLDEIEQILARNERFSAQKNVLVKQFTQELTEARQQGREQQIRLEQSRKETRAAISGAARARGTTGTLSPGTRNSRRKIARINYPNPAARSAASAGNNSSSPSGKPLERLRNGSRFSPRLKPPNPRCRATKTSTVAFKIGSRM